MNYTSVVLRAQEARYSNTCSRSSIRALRPHGAEGEGLEHLVAGTAWRQVALVEQQLRHAEGPGVNPEPLHLLRRPREVGRGVEPGHREVRGERPILRRKLLLQRRVEGLGQGREAPFVV